MVILLPTSNSVKNNVLVPVTVASPFVTAHVPVKFLDDVMVGWLVLVVVKSKIDTFSIPVARVVGKAIAEVPLA